MITHVAAERSDSSGRRHMATVILRPGRLFDMNGGRPHAPTLASLASVLPEYGKFTFDRTLEAARCDIRTKTEI